MEKIILSKYISNGCVLQSGKNTNIRGKCKPNTVVKAEFQNKTYITNSDENGLFIFGVNADVGYGYELKIQTDESEKVVSDILVGDVYICVGQSNMELPMLRVREKYPDELGEKNIKEFKVFENESFNIENDFDFKKALWRKCSGTEFEKVSAFGYFFSKLVYKEKDIPVGFVNISVGGSKVESFMDIEYLKGYKNQENLINKFSDKNYRENFFKEQAKREDDWHRKIILEEEFSKNNFDEKNYKQINLPNFFKDEGIKNFSGLIYLRKKFYIDAKDIERIKKLKSAKLYLGTISDSDKVYLNSVFVGETGYKYPPRIYEFNVDLLKEGENEVFIRLEVRDENGRFTKDKRYEIQVGDILKISLCGTWDYQLVVKSKNAPELIFPNEIPTSLYNGMLNRAFFISTRAFIWYQGESNDKNAYEYKDLLIRFINSLRKKWKVKSLPCVIVGLPRCNIDINGDWEVIRNAQESVAKELEEVYYVDNSRLGEENDLHPLDKSEMAENTYNKIKEKL